tara:strand:- start:24 stop:374 length:351 start_codon:yes stop_codon:yes gene_type:complete
MPLLLLFLRLVTVMKNDTFPDRFGPSFDRRRKPFDLATFVTSTDVLLLLLPVVVVVEIPPPPPLFGRSPTRLRSSKEEGSADVLMTIYIYIYIQNQFASLPKYISSKDKEKGVVVV